METTLAQQKALAIVPKVSASLSVLCSGIICCIIVLNRVKLRLTYHRLVLGMSVCDLASSLAWFMSTWPIPRGTPGVWGAVGTQKTCTAQGFFSQFSISTVMYNASLCIYYVLVICKGWGEKRIAKIEPFLHIHPFVWGFSTALAGVCLGLFNNALWDCWIVGKPLECKESWKNHGETTCERGDDATLYHWFFFYGPLWCVIFFVAVSMCFVYKKVNENERVHDRYLSEGQRRNRKNSRIVASQALCYVGAFLITWGFPTLYQIVIARVGTIYYSTVLLKSMSVPFQGVFNLLVYIRPKYMSRKQANSSRCFLTTFFQTLCEELGISFPKKKEDSNAECEVQHGQQAREDAANISSRDMQGEERIESDHVTASVPKV